MLICLSLQLRDRSVFRDSKHLGRLLPRVLPRPRRYRLAWKETRGSSAIYVWALEPPDEAFVSLGMLATPSPEPPARDASRCVPRAWCEPVSEDGLQAVWQQGLAGGLWRVLQTGMLVASRNAEAPEGTCFQLRRDMAAGEVRLADNLVDVMHIKMV